jgi:hypothetical protein
MSLFLHGGADTVRQLYLTHVQDKPSCLQSDMLRLSTTACNAITFFRD